MKVQNKNILYDYQYDAVDKMHNGCILNGGVGSGKSRTAIYYYFKEQGGTHKDGVRKKMVCPKDLYIITTARKRDTKEFEGELGLFSLSVHQDINTYDNKVVVDSWNNITHYEDVTNAFFIFDEQRVTGKGVWVKTFLKITKKNNWILLSATPGDTWLDYIPVFLANGYYRTRNDFYKQHVKFSNFSKFPKVERYYGTKQLEAERDSLLIDMDFSRKTVAHHIEVECEYSKTDYKDIMRDHWNPWDNLPIENSSSFMYILRKVVNAHPCRIEMVEEIMEEHPKVIIFYNFNYELESLEEYFIENGIEYKQWNGHKHEDIPNGDKWAYLVQYTAGAEGWNCIKTDTIIFYSLNYSYKIMEQSQGRIDRLNSPFVHLYYYHLYSKAPIDMAIKRAINDKRNFNESRFINKSYFKVSPYKQIQLKLD